VVSAAYAQRKRKPLRVLSHVTATKTFNRETTELTE
jgi:hypothetical protein